MGVLLHADPDQGDVWHRQQKTWRARARRFDSQPRFVPELENPHGARMHAVSADTAATKTDASLTTINQLVHCCFRDAASSREGVPYASLFFVHRVSRRIRAFVGG